MASEKKLKPGTDPQQDAFDDVIRQWLDRLANSNPREEAEALVLRRIDNYLKQEVARPKTLLDMIEKRFNERLRSDFRRWDDDVCMEFLKHRPDYLDDIEREYENENSNV